MADESLEDEKLREEIEILKLERQRVQKEMSSAGLFGWTKQYIPTIAAIVALLVSVVGIVISFLSAGLQVRQATDAARAALAESFRKTLASATEPGAPIESRISSIWSLKTFWGTEHETTLANALAAMLVSDEHQRLRLTAADVIGEAYDSSTPQSQMQERATLLYGTRSGQEGVVLRQQLFLPPSSSKNSSYEERRTAIVEAIRRNWEWLRGVHLRRADLRGGEFYETDFRDADLQEVNFQFANLCGSNFSNALTDGIKLEHANLYGVRGLDPKLLDEALRRKAVSMPLEQWRLWKAAGMLVPSDDDWHRWKNDRFRVDSFGQPRDKANGIIVATPILRD